ncbi:MAG: hypothetical protein HWE24_14815 [Oceanospirillaceae bacterium]|nr:hypothetical protein [Oceanospirillaceae bacterium]
MKPNNATQQTRTPSDRVIILDDNVIEESEEIRFLSWKCRKYSSQKVLVELGKVNFLIETENELRDNFGFILFDGSDTGSIAIYRRVGIEHRWDWDDGKYAFTIKADGTGLYYDFSNSETGREKAKDVFECKKD